MNRLLWDILISGSSFIAVTIMMGLTSIYLRVKYKEWSFFRKETEYEARLGQFKVWRWYAGSFFLSCWLFYFKQIVR